MMEGSGRYGIFFIIAGRQSEHKLLSLTTSEQNRSNIAARGQ